MNTYEVTIYNNGAKFDLHVATVKAADPYTASMRALAGFLPLNDAGALIVNFRKDHLIIGKIVQKAEDTIIYQR